MTKHRLDEQTDSQPSIGALFTSAFEDMGTLVQHEVALAKQELRVSVKRGGVGMALLAVCGFLLLLALVIASVGIAHVIHLSGLNLAWCYLIVAGGYVLIAVIVALIAIRMIKKVRGPEQAIEEAKATKAALFERDSVTSTNI